MIIGNEDVSGYRGEASLLRPPSDHFRCRESTTTTTSTTTNNNREGESEGSGNLSCNVITKTSAATVAFQCTVSPQSLSDENNKQTDAWLTFHCREPSYGVLTSDEPTAATSKQQANDDDDSNGDNDDCEEEDENETDLGSMMLFYEEKYPYALAGKTGFQIWPGTRIIVDALTFPRPSGLDPSSLQNWQRRVLGGDGQRLRILELGAGVGVVGTSLAVAGAEVLLTDLSKVVSQSLIPNLELNHRNFNTRHQKYDQPQKEECSCSPPTWLNECHSSSSSSSSTDPAFRIGRGWAAAKSLDWNESVQSQLTKEQRDVDLIIASDCVWLASMLEGLLNTVEAIFEEATARRGVDDDDDDDSCHYHRLPTLLLSFQRRDNDMFTTVERVLIEILDRQWQVECLAWYPVTYDDDDDDDEEEGGDIGTEDCQQQKDTTSSPNQQQQEINAISRGTTKEVFVFEVSPCSPLR